MRLADFGGEFSELAGKADPNQSFPCQELAADCRCLTSMSSCLFAFDVRSAPRGRCNSATFLCLLEADSEAAGLSLDALHELRKRTFKSLRLAASADTWPHSAGSILPPPSGRP